MTAVACTSFVVSYNRSPNLGSYHVWYWVMVLGEEGHQHCSPLPLARCASKLAWPSTSGVARMMSAFLRVRLAGSSGKLSSVLLSRSPRGEAPLAQLFLRGSPRLLSHRSVPARTSLPPTQDHAAPAVATRPTAPVETTARQLQEELFRVLCEPRPSSPSLLALVRGIVAAGAEPSPEVVQALADHFSEAKDAKSLKVRSPWCTPSGQTLSPLWISTQHLEL